MEKLSDYSVRRNVCASKEWWEEVYEYSVRNNTNMSKYIREAVNARIESDRGKLGSKFEQCKLCVDNDKWWSDLTEASIYTCREIADYMKFSIKEQIKRDKRSGYNKE